AQPDRVPEHEGPVPLVFLLVLQRRLLLLVELLQHLEPVRVARDERGAAKEVGLVGHAVLFAELAGVGDVLLGGDALRGRGVSGTMIGAATGGSGGRRTFRGFSTRLRAPRPPVPA